MLGKVAFTQPEDGHLPYRNLVGDSWLFGNTTRPDILFAVHVLTQHFKGWSHSHWIAAKRLLRYLKGTKNYSLCYSYKQGSGMVSIGYCDADRGSNEEDRHSVSEVVFIACRRTNLLICWLTRKQSNVATSTCELTL